MKDDCRGTVRLWLELVFKHLVKGCGWPRENRQIVGTSDLYARRCGHRVEPS